MSKFIVVGTRRDGAHPWNYYLCKSGYYSTMTSNIAILSESEARLECEYHNRGNARYEFHVEQLPRGRFTDKSVLNATPV